MSHIIRASKSLGQNFLKNSSVPEKIIKHAGQLADEIVLEIGPGLGMLTKTILQTPLQKLICVEKDEACIEYLKENLQGDIRLTLIEADALKIYEEALLEADQKLVVIANLPYNIGCKLLLKWLRKIPLFKKFVLMFQREVAERICAAPNNKQYGSLSVLAQTMCVPKLLFHVPPTAFSPQPKITSSVVLLTPRPDVANKLSAYTNLEKICAMVFSKRRKTLNNACKSLFPDTTETLLSLGLNPHCRPENLTVEDFFRLASECEGCTPHTPHG